MCGVLGFVTSNPSKENYKLFRRCLLLSESRGKDATGIAISDGTKVLVDKSPVPSSEYIKNILPIFEDQISKSNLVIGHTRHGTIGDAKDNNNNHPIVSQDWVMIHNGTCSTLDKVPGYKYMGEVDSEIYLSHIQDKGLREGVAEIKNNSAAIALINKSDPTKLHLFKHSQSLYIAYDDHSQTVFFASTDDLLEYSLANRLLVFSTYVIKKVVEDIVYSFSYNPLDLKLSSKIEIKKSYGYNYGRRDYSNYTQYGEGQWRYTGDKSNVLNVKEESTLPYSLIWKEQEKWWEAAKSKKEEENAPETKVFTSDVEEEEEFVSIIVFLNDKNEIIGYQLSDDCVKEIEKEANKEADIPPAILTKENPTNVKKIEEEKKS